MKKAYLEQVLADPKPKKPYDDEVEECDEDLAKSKTVRRKVAKQTV